MYSVSPGHADRPGPALTKGDDLFSGGIVIRIDELIIDPDIQLGERKLDDGTVQNYSIALSNNAKFPPIVVFSDGTDNWLSDGFHRVKAAQRLGLVTIDADVREGTKQDAIVYAAIANVANGRPMSAAQKREAGARLLELTDWSQHRIAQELAVDAKTVTNWKATMENSIVNRAVVGADGRTYDTSNIGRRAERDDEPGVANLWDVQGDRDDGPEGILVDGVWRNEDDETWCIHLASYNNAGEAVCKLTGDVVDLTRCTSFTRPICQNFTDEDMQDNDPARGATAYNNHAISDTPGYDGDEWYTPAEYIESARLVMGGIDLDPASCDAAQAEIQATRYYTKEDDGLAHQWEGRVFLNPPYSMPLVAEFVEKALTEFDAGHIDQAIILTNNCTDTRWFHSLLRFPLCLTRGRVQFWRPDHENFGTRQGQAFFYLGPNVERFIDEFTQHGVVLGAL